jgi:nucleoside-diphosphate-sugar epimerase
MRRVLEMIWECLDHDELQNQSETSHGPSFVIPVRLAYGIIWSVSLLARMLGQKPWISTSELGDSISVRYFDNSQAREVLGYVPEHRLEDSIQLACRTYKTRLGNRL